MSQTLDTKKNLPTKDKVETGKPNFASTFNDHVTRGVIHGGQINGLHCLSSYISEGKPITKTNVQTDDRVDEVYKANVTVAGGTKAGTSPWCTDPPVVLGTDPA